MKGRTIAVANQKGGVAKTTTCISLGAALTEMGRTVLLIDLDPQANLTLSFKLTASDQEGGSARTKQPGRGGIMDALIGNSSLLEVSQETQIPGLYVAPAGRQLVLVDKVFYQLTGYQYRLREALAATAVAATGQAFDYVLIDCPPSLATLTLNALTAAGLLIIPLQCELYAAQSVRQMLRLADQVREQCNPTLEHRLLVTMYDMRNKISQIILDQLRRARGAQMFETIIQIDTKLRESPAYGKPITTYASGSRAAQQYRALAEELLAAEDAGAEGAGSPESQAEVDAAGPDGNQPLAIELEASWTEAPAARSGEEHNAPQGRRRPRLVGGSLGQGETRV